MKGEEKRPHAIGEGHRVRLRRRHAADSSGADGAACHEGYQSCFFRSVQDAGADFKITEAQLAKPEEIYGKK